MLYQIKNLSYRYQVGTEVIQALHEINTSIPKEAFICISGPSGSGKSTLLGILGLTESPGPNQVFLSGQDVAVLSPAQKNRIRKYQLGFIFQSFHLFPTFNAQENVEFFLARQGIPGPERNKRVEQALHSVGLWEHRKKRPMQMSGGQKQRVAIARALAKNPEVIIADEPTASLDQKTGREIMEILLELNARSKVAVIIASHDPMVQSLSPSRIHLVDGKL